MDTQNRMVTVEQRDRLLGAEQLIPSGNMQIEATLDLSPSARGVVALLHAASADRFAPRNLFAARTLQQVGLATLQADLLTPNEEAAGAERVCENTALMAERILAVVDWLSGESTTAHLPLGVLASERVTTALLAAAPQRLNVRALVVRGKLSDALPPGAPVVAAVPGYEEPGALPRFAEQASEFFIEQLVRRR
jgi:hypothetical protein